MIQIIVALLIIVVAALYWRVKRPSGAPPGPLCFPLVGSIPLLDKHMYKSMLKWREQYGDTFTFRFGPQLFVMLNKYDTVRKVLNDENSSGREQSQTASDIAKKNGQLHGLVGSENNLWKVHRRFALSALRDFGMGKTWMEDAILDEVNDLCSQITKHCEEPFWPRTVLSHSVSNVICAMIFGKRFDHSDHRFNELVRMMNEIMMQFDKIAILDVLPILKHFPNKASRALKDILRTQNQLKEFFEQTVREHRERASNGEGRRDYIDAYLLEAKKHTKDDLFSEFQLIFSIFDLFGAGTETTSTTLLWSLVYLMSNRDVLTKIRKEIDEHVLPGELVRMSDKNSLPFTEATILEVQRLSSLLPFNVPHKIFQETMIDGYQIPAGTMLMTNIYHIHRDPALWKNPEEFDPSRFLDRNGKVTRPDGFMPFSIGKRACLGESLARMELWLFFANIIRRFDFKPASGVIDTEVDSGSSIIHFPKQQEMIFTALTR